MPQNTTKTLHGTLMLMIVLQTVGTVDTRRKMPAPKQYAAIAALWGIFFLGADLGQERLMRALAVLVLLPTIVIGPFGKRFLMFVEMVSHYFQTTQTGPTPPGAASPVPGATRPGVFSGPSPSDTQTAGFAAPVPPQEQRA